MAGVISATDSTERIRVAPKEFASPQKLSRPQIVYETAFEISMNLLAVYSPFASFL